MTHDDLVYFEVCMKRGFVQTPFLEIGSARVQGKMPNLCIKAKEYGIDPVLGVDLELGIGVDLVFDFGMPVETFQSKWSHGTFSTVAIFNVLEHTFDPLTVLRNALYCVRPGGSLLVLTPAIWALHSYPNDFLRLNPDWYVEFANRFKIQLYHESFCWLSEFGSVKIADLMVNQNYVFPNFLTCGLSQNPWRYWVTRIAHKLFNTYGRSHSLTSVSIGATFLIPK